jgi:hypothetical protein
MRAAVCIFPEIRQNTKFILFALLLIYGMICFLLWSPEKAFCLDIEPFYTYNQSPLIQVHGLPPVDDALIAPAGRIKGILSLDAANNYVVESNDREDLTLDGESYRFTLAARYGVANGVECGIDVPVIAYGGGFLDGFIEDFHHFFGFPNGGREQAPRDRLLYQYNADGNNRLNIRDSSSGIGDIRLTGALQLFRNDDAAVALRASLKLPTGESARLLGSGNTDFAIWFSAKEDYKLPALGHISGFGGIGGMVMGDGDVLKGMQRTLAGFGSLGFGWSPLEWLALKVQADGHTPLYQGSGLKAVNGSSLQLVSGGTFGIGKNTSLDLGVSEDIIVETSPDVVFHIALRTMF